MDLFSKLIRRFGDLFLLIVIGIISFVLISKNSTYQHYVLFTNSSHLIGVLNQQTHNIGRYLSLKKDNAKLFEENVRLLHEVNRLRNQLHYQEEQADSAYIFADMDFAFIPAKVINTSIYKQHNYLTINKGTRDSVEAGMGVISRDGLVGIVKTTSEHFSLIVPLIHARSQISCKIKGTDIYGTVSWDGKDWRETQIRDIIRHIPIHLKDTIVTSDYSYNFPKDIPIGIITEKDLDKDDAYHILSVELFVDYKSITEVYVIKNFNAQEQQMIEDEAI